VFDVLPYSHIVKQSKIVSVGPISSHTNAKVVSAPCYKISYALPVNFHQVVVAVTVPNTSWNNYTIHIIKEIVFEFVSGKNFEIVMAP
jgi:hypothetical protein